MNYLLVRQIHIACVALSGAAFLWRGTLMLRASPLLDRRWLRVVPHLVDTLLLASGVTLASRSAQYPLAQDWLTAKLVALLCYIALGTMALKRGRTRGVRLAFLIAAVLTYGYIVSVALTRNARGFFVVFI